MVGQVDQRDLVEADVDQAFLVGAADAGQSFVAHGRTRCGPEDAALAGATTTDQRHARAAVAAQQRAAQGDSGD